MISKIVFLARPLGIAVTLIALLSAGEMRASNILTNSGFETGDLTSWTTYGNSIGNISVQSGGSGAHGGSYYLKTYGQFISALNYSGVYQDNASGPGVTYSGRWLALLAFW